MIRCTTLACTIAAFLCVSAHRASADIYQYVDDDGVIHFSNVSVGNGKKYRKVHSESRHAEYVATSSRPHASSAPASSPSQMKSIPSAYAEMINTACSRHGVDPALVHAIVKVESDFNPFALSRKGAMGLMQLMPQTATIMNVRNIYSPDENIDGGVRYLRYLLDRYEGNISLALAAYNSGETAVQKWGTIPPFPETQSYVQRILKLYNGTGISAPTRYTIYIGYGDDGALLLTDDPSKRAQAKSARKGHKSL